MTQNASIVPVETPPSITYGRATRGYHVRAERTEVLGSDQRSHLRNALVVAAEKFDENAKLFNLAADRTLLVQLEQIPAEGVEIVNVEAYHSLGNQFTRQADQVRALIALIDGGDDDEEDPAVLIVQRPVTDDLS